MKSLSIPYLGNYSIKIHYLMNLMLDIKLKKSCMLNYINKIETITSSNYH